MGVGIVDEKKHGIGEVLGFVQKAAVDAVSAVGTIGGSAVSGVVSAANSVGGTISKTTKQLGGQAVKLADRNGDGKLDEQDVLLILGSIYDSAVNGIPKVGKPIDTFSDEYLKRAPDAKAAARKMIDNSVIKCTTSGFLTGFGGLISLPVTLPANVTSVLYVQLRMIASVAYMAGLDIHSDATQTLVYACLAGVSVAEVVKKTGVQFGQKLTNAMIQKIPGKTLTAINQKVGFRFITKFGEKGIINIGKMIPVVGAAISGGFDLAETRIIANRAYKGFMESNFALSVADEAEGTPE
ncbi:MAG: EcsC family protein [Clostridia bacterium]|nr:EcsC family protein [Clostridia bacterium]